MTVNWVHNDEDKHRWEAWTLVVKPESQWKYERELNLVRYLDSDPNVWVVCHNQEQFGTLPLDMPQEELFAMAITMWRMG